MADKRNPLLPRIAAPNDNPLSASDVYEYNAPVVADAWRAARDPETWREAARAYADALLAGSVAPGMKGIRAFHGSPYDFDKFSLSKIGTGEGNQAFGHGLYFAQAENTARQYRDQLANRPVVNNASLFENMPWMSRNAQKQASWALDQAVKSGLNGDDAVKAAMAVLTREGDAASASHVRQPYYDATNALSDLLGKKWQASPGHMYEVNLAVAPEQLLDWDKPLGQQPKVVQEALKQHGITDPNLVGSKLLSEVHYSQYGPDGPKGQVSRPEELLQSAGVPGIQYLDAGSRSAGEGSRNYVMFSDDLIKILRKYGLAGLTTAGAAAASRNPLSSDE